jgi:hypothetical protein
MQIVTKTAPSPLEALVAQLLDTGYLILPRIIDPVIVAQIDAETEERFSKSPFCQGLFYGSQTKRFGSLLTRSTCAHEFVQHRLILDIVTQILSPYCDTIGLNLTQAIEVHPDSPIQVPHRDQDMWGGEKGSTEYLVNVMWPFTDYRYDTGATLIWPKSNHHQNEMILPADQAIAAEMSSGSALIFLGSTLHGAGANTSPEVRRGMIISYCLGWLKPYENQWLCYPPEVAKHFSPELAALVGYQQHRPNLGNYDGQCPSVLLADHVPEHLPAIDSLRPDQEALIAQYLAGELEVPLAA